MQDLVSSSMTEDEQEAFKNLKGHQQDVASILNSVNTEDYKDVYLAVMDQLELVNRLYEEINEIYANSSTVDEYDATKKIYWQAQDINAQGQIKAAKYGNDVETKWNYDEFGRIVDHHSYNIDTSDTLIVSNSYQYDAIGNLTDRKDFVENVFEDFNYDNMNRLVQSDLSGTGAALVRKMNLNTTTYAYDEIGNIEYKSDIAGCDSLGCYQYGQGINENGAGPHAVNSITGLGSFNYDANGNMTSGRGRSIEYSAFNKPTKISKNSKDTTMLYGPERQMIKQIEQTSDGLETTSYVGSGFELIKKPGGAATQRHHISIGGHAITVVDTLENSIVPIKEHYLHKNHQNSVIAITDMNGDIVERRHYDAFGDVKSNVGQAAAYEAGIPYSSVTDLSFTSHRFLKSADLVHMGGRVYDPFIGRFLSADPHIQASLNSQSFNRYSYVLNNPLSMTDPSGYFFSWFFNKLKKLFDKLRGIIDKILRHIKKKLKTIVRAFKRIDKWAVRQGIKAHDLLKKLPIVGGIEQSKEDYIAKSSWAQAILIFVAGAFGGPGAAAGMTAYITYTQGGNFNQIRKAGRSSALAGYFGKYGGLNFGGWLVGNNIFGAAINSAFITGLINKIQGKSFTKDFFKNIAKSIIIQYAVQVLQWVAVKIRQGVEWVKSQADEFAGSGTTPSGISNGVSTDARFDFEVKNNTLTGEVIVGCSNVTAQMCSQTITDFKGVNQTDGTYTIDLTIRAANPGETPTFELHGGGINQLYNGWFDRFRLFGHNLDREIHLFPGNAGFTTETTVHEFGHFLGLAHQPNSTNSFMSYSTTRFAVPVSPDIIRLLNAYRPPVTDLSWPGW